MTNLSKNNKNKKFNSFKKISGIKNKMLASGMTPPRGVLSGGRVEPVEKNVKKRVRIVNGESYYNDSEGEITGLTEGKLVVKIDEVDGEVNFEPEDLELTQELEPTESVDKDRGAAEVDAENLVIRSSAERAPATTSSEAEARATAAEEKAAAVEERVRELARAEAAALARAEAAEKLLEELEELRPQIEKLKKEETKREQISSKAASVPAAPELPEAIALDSNLSFHDFEQQLSEEPKDILLRNCPTHGVSKLITNISKVKTINNIVNMFSQKPTYIFDHFKEDTSLKQIVSYYQFIEKNFVQRSAATVDKTMLVYPFYKYAFLRSYKYPTTLLEEKTIKHPGTYYISYTENKGLNLGEIFTLDTDAEKTNAKYETSEGFFPRTRVSKDYSWKDKGKNYYSDTKKLRQFQIVYDTLNNMYLIAVSKKADEMVTDSSRGIDYTPLVAAGIIYKNDYVDDKLRCRFVYYDARSSKEINLRFTDFSLDKGVDTDQIIEVFKIFNANKDQRNMYLLPLSDSCQQQFGLNDDYSIKTDIVYTGSIQDIKQRGFFGRGKKSIKNNLKLKSKSKSLKKK